MTTVTITPDSNHATIENLQGFSIYEDTGAATALVRLRKESASGTIMFHLTFAANESIQADGLGQDQNGIAFEGGVYVEEVSGSVTGVLHGE